MREIALYNSGEIPCLLAFNAIRLGEGDTPHNNTESSIIFWKVSSTLNLNNDILVHPEVQKCRIGSMMMSSSRGRMGKVCKNPSVKIISTCSWC